ncbi:hypothetical protein Slin15195_G123140 [Septoria linicola]|uniref:Fungal N-terminal domain-containing protein n=1 Tax=Septoria linicola TaxID=215465 RepID=A0A9Q9EQC9_9PEZI|nr:hypothetical protein Slin14017_G079340 [Septoria linicola]USW58995.1 hypothetical protein Slin15195_G123140 [Septoria linicola]
MSGVEAVFGVAAGGIGVASLSIQLFESAIKLRKIYNTVKNAPKRYEKLSKDLETVTLAIKSLGQCSNDNQHTALLCQALSRCEENINSIQTRVTQLLARYAQKGGKLQVALTDFDLDTMIGALESSKNSQHFAYTISRYQTGFDTSSALTTGIC